MNFLVFLFWLSLFIFLFNNSNFISLLFYSELTWIILYNFTILSATNFDDLNLISISFFILGLAGLEFSFGFLLLILFKAFNASFNFKVNKKNSQLITNNSYYNTTIFNKFFWIK